MNLTQQVLDDIFADDSPIRIYQPAPYIETTDGTTSYTFAEILDSSPFVDGDGDTLIRRIRGIYDPSLSPTDPDLTDYNRRYIPTFEQKDIKKRVYDGDIYIDNERKTVTFKSNPGDTTDTWKADLYLMAPRITESSVIPLLTGWEKRLLLPGCRSWYEDLDEGSGLGPQAQLFNEQKKLYRDAIERENKLDNTTTDLGIKIDQNHVQPL